MRLGDEVASTPVKQLDYGLFADGSRHENHRDRLGAAVEQLERTGGIESRHSVIGKDYVRCSPIEHIEQFPLVFRAFPFHGEAVSFQREGVQVGIVLRILEDKNPQPVR